MHDLLIKQIIKQVICIDFYMTCQLNQLNMSGGQVDRFNKQVVFGLKIPDAFTKQVEFGSTHLAEY